MGATASAITDATTKGAVQRHERVATLPLPRPSTSTNAPVITAASARCSDTCCNRKWCIHTDPIIRLPNVEPKIFDAYVQLTSLPALDPAATPAWHSSGITEPISAATTKNAGAANRNHMLAQRTCIVTGASCSSVIPFHCNSPTS